jgi:hypothetical protein
VSQLSSAPRAQESLKETREFKSRFNYPPLDFLWLISLVSPFCWQSQRCCGLNNWCSSFNLVNWEVRISPFCFFSAIRFFFNYCVDVSGNYFHDKCPFTATISSDKLQWLRSINNNIRHFWMYIHSFWKCVKIYSTWDWWYMCQLFKAAEIWMNTF